MSYLDGKAPEILREVASTNAVPENITVRRVVFRSRDNSEIFALIATPKTPGKHPGMLVLHGGGGSAAIDQAMAWGQRGYEAVAPDMPGIADPKKLAATKGKWSAVKYGENRWLAVKHPRGVVAELKSKNDRTAVLSSIYNIEIGVIKS